MKIRIDFETRCLIDVRDVGAYNYARHPSCEALMLSYNFTDNKANTKLWNFNDPPPRKLLERVRKGAKLVAWNSFFEYCIWQYVCVPKLGWPKLYGIKQMLDPSDKAKAMALPQKLEECVTAMHLPDIKNPAGAKLIQKFSVPQKDGKFVDPLAPENAEDWRMFGVYCVDDTNAMIGVDNILLDLTPHQQNIAWAIDRINLRGLYIDATAVKAADRLTQQVREKYNTLAAKLSGGAFEKCTQRQKVKDWLRDECGITLPNMQGDTIKVWLRKTNLPEKARQMLEYYQIAGSTSASKYAAMLKYINPITKRVHELLNFHRARTGRLGGAGIQLQNLPRPTLPKGTNYDEVIEVIKHGTLDNLLEFSAMLGVTPMQVLSSAVRSVITAMFGNMFVVSDYEQIEARLLFWQAGDWDALDIFRRGEDIYLEMASQIYNKPLAEMTKESPERPLGKETILGAGYGIGPPKFRKRVDETAGIKISEKMSQNVISAYRERFERVPILWKELGKQALLTVKQNVRYGNRQGEERVRRQSLHRKTVEDRPHLRMGMVELNGQKFLIIRKPSGNLLWYPDAAIREGKYGEEICYSARDPYTTKWTTVSTHGAKIVENVVQGEAADLINDKLMLLEKSDFPIVLQIHDEVGAEIAKPLEKGKVFLKLFEDIFTSSVNWLFNFPLSSEGWVGLRFRK